jgi:hypothetical protein
MTLQRHLDKTDLWELKYHAVASELVGEQLRSIGLEEQLLQLSLGNVARRKQECERKLQQLTSEADAAVKRVEKKYGVQEAEEIDWNTGEILEAATAADAAVCRSDQPSDSRATSSTQAHRGRTDHPEVAVGSVQSSQCCSKGCGTI